MLTRRATTGLVVGQDEVEHILDEVLERVAGTPAALRRREQPDDKARDKGAEAPVDAPARALDSFPEPFADIPGSLGGRLRDG